MLRCTSVHNIIVICVELAPNTYSLPPVRSTDTIQGALCQTVVSDEPTNTYGAALKSPRRPGAALRLYTDITRHHPPIRLPAPASDAHVSSHPSCDLFSLWTYAHIPPVIGSHYGHMLTSFLRLVLTTAICSRPSCDWFSLVRLLLLDEHAVALLPAVAAIHGVELALEKGPVGAYDDERVLLRAKRHDALRGVLRQPELSERPLRAEILWQKALHKREGGPLVRGVRGSLPRGGGVFAPGVGEPRLLGGPPPLGDVDDVHVHGALVARGGQVLPVGRER
eukprot:1185060-Prorocentrum_minimum.AAC.1